MQKARRRSERIWVRGWGGAGGIDTVCGAGVSVGYSGAQIKVNFTSEERDAGSGLDCFGARYFSAA
jgi:hypothetical protein